MAEKKDSGPLNPLVVTSAGGVGAATMASHHFASGLRSEAEAEHRCTDAQCLEDRVLFAHPGAAGCVRDAPGVGAPQPAEGLEVQGWVAAAVLGAGTHPD